MASAIVAIALERYQPPHIFNLTNIHSISWHEFINLAIVYGYKIEFISVEDWKNNYLSSLSDNNALFPFKELYINAHYRMTESPDITADSVVNNALKILHHKNIVMPLIDSKTILDYLAVLEKVGFLPHKNKFSISR